MTHWLLTRASDGTANPDYAAWLGRVGVTAEWIGPQDPRPDSASAYGALLLTGGGDVEPARYGTIAHPATQDIDRARDDLEAELVERFLQAGRPVFGICRGIQMLNVALGGGLIQDLPNSRLPMLCAIQVERHTAATPGDVFHRLIVEKRDGLAAALRDVEEVNSRHHQALAPDAVGRGLHVVARSPSGVIEAVEGHGLGAPVVAVQWHPERLPPRHPASAALLDYLMDRVRNP